MLNLLNFNAFFKGTSIKIFKKIAAMKTVIIKYPPAIIHSCHP